MASGALVVATTTTNYDTAATPNTVPMRDNAGGCGFSTCTASTLQTTGNLQGNVQTKTAAFTAGGATDYVVDATAASFAVGFPLASANAGVIFNFFKSTSANTVTLTGVVGTGTLTTINTGVRVFSDGTNWLSR